MVSQKIKKTLSKYEDVESKVGADPVKLWDAHREQAAVWRVIALLQMPVTFLAIFAALVMFAFKDTIVEILPKPKPGYYHVDEIPNSAFIDVAMEVASLFATYQYVQVDQQYEIIKRFLWEPALSDFGRKIEEEKKRIAEARRSQMFVVDNSLTVVERSSRDSVKVILEGTGYRFTAKRKNVPWITKFFFTMKTVPRNVINPYGIIITDLGVEAKQSELLGK